MKKKFKITEGQLQKAIKESLMEMPFGDNSEGEIRNPADNYQFNPQEIIQKCVEFKAYLKSFKEYFDGVDEEVEGEEHNNGVRFNVNLKNMWTDDWTLNDLSETLDTLSSLIFKLNSCVDETIDCAETIMRYR